MKKNSYIIRVIGVSQDQDSLGLEPILGDDESPTTFNSNLWWLSFCDGDRPEGSQFLGVVISEGSNVADAAMNAHSRGVNPGGEVLGIPINVPSRSEKLLRDHMWKLLPLEECKKLDREMMEMSFD